MGVFCAGILEVSTAHSAGMDFAGAILTAPTAIDTRNISVEEGRSMSKAAGDARWGIITNRGCFNFVEFVKPLGDYWDPYHFAVSVDPPMKVGTYRKNGIDFLFLETGAKGRLGILFTQDVKACQGLSDALAGK